jgi:hypothetical protein
MKRSDLDSQLILGTVACWGVHAWERLVEKYPPKLVLAAIEREVGAGRLNYGVAMRRPFLTDQGRAAIQDQEPFIPPADPPPGQQNMPDRPVFAQVNAMIRGVQ